MEYKLDANLSSKLEFYRSAIETTVKSYIKINLKDNKNPTCWVSKLGRLPYMPKDFEYPKSFSGEYLYLLAQINFAEVPSIKELPNEGILQFYLANDNMYGCNLKEPTKQDQFRVVYFPEVCLKENEIVKDFSFLRRFNNHNLPFEGCSSIGFKIAQEPISIDDYQFSIFGSDDIPNDLYDEYKNNFQTTGHKLLGYPNFTQEDPRSYFLDNQDDSSEAYILLLQINSCQNSNIRITWGDMGIANFFIKRSDLNRLDFSNVLYNWDCT